ncbi:MAG: carbohydrate ABC transporter permease [Christensenellales bacterium]|jgi:raffinose/stachyose/melibiose transport system permease protein
MYNYLKRKFSYSHKSAGQRYFALKEIIRTLSTLLLICIVLLPFYVAILYAFKPVYEISANRLAFTQSPTLINFYEVIFENKQFISGFKNTVLNTIPTVLILVVTTSMSSWVLARFNTRFYSLMYSIMTVGLLIPFQCYILPLYVNFFKLGLVSNNIGFIIARSGLQISISLVAVTGFVKTVPRELEEASSIDGCSRFATFWKIVFPLMTPINITQLVLNTVFVWNDYSTAIILLRSKESQTLTLAQITYFNENTTLLNHAFAFFILAMFPILVLYLSLQKYIVSGITAGAVKG